MSGFNIAANMYGAFPNTYNNQVALNDLCDLDLYSPMAGMGMNDSIFNSPMGMGYTPMYGGNYQDYYKNYEKYQDYFDDIWTNKNFKYDIDLKINKKGLIFDIE